MDREKYIEALAKRIRAGYCAEYRRWEEREGKAGHGTSTYGHRPIPYLDGGTGVYGTRYKGVWPRIAQFCVSNGIDHDLLVGEFFEMYRQSTDPPQANNLTGAASLAVYARAARLQKEEAAQSFRSESRQVKVYLHLATRENPGEPEAVVWTRAVTNPQADYSPLFRYCLACNIGAYPVADIYREDAFWQYMRSPKIYDDVMPELIPQSLRDQAARIHEAMS